MKLSQHTPNLNQTILVYGPPKTGKTQLVGELAEQGKKLIWFDLENGAATLTKLSPEAQDRVELITLPDTKSFPIAIETCLKVIKGGPVDICEEHGKVMCLACKKENKPTTHVELNSLDLDTVVVFDSLTQMVDSAISHITQNQPDDYKLDYDDWAKLGKVMSTFLSYVQQAKFNVVCISHEVEAESEDGKQKLVPVSGTRNFSRNTAKYFGHVLYSSIALNKHKFISSTTGGIGITTGSRTDVVTDKMEKASLISIFKNPVPQAKSPGQIAAGSLQGLLSKPLPKA